MPIYEYECVKCQRDFESLVLGKDDGVRCPSCHSDRVKKLMSAVAFKSSGDFASSTSSGCAGCSSGSCSTCK
jgi:putative FmdB family regulatory protein